MSLTLTRALSLYLTATLAGTGLLVPHVVRAGPEWSMCAPLELPARPEIERDPDDPGATYISADDAQMVEGGMSTLTGDVDIARGTSQIRADVVRYDQPQASAHASGDVRFWDEGLFVSGDRADMDLVGDVTALEGAEYLLVEGHARGRAQHVELRGEDLVHIRDATYTSCDPGAEDWLLSARRIDLDKVEDVGTARNVWVEFKGMPIFYTPFLTFPLSDARKSGFLAPSFGTSSSTGVEATVPYYFNLAPNQDATLALRGMSDRGVQAEGEFRYLRSWGRGVLGVEHMPNDRELGDDRSAVALRHEGSFAPRWHTDVDVGWVSDDDYFEDLGTNLAIASRSFLERRGDLVYHGRGWAGLARLQEYQTIDDTITPAGRPYERLPQLRLWTSTVERNREINVGGAAEFVNFERRFGVTGSRVDLYPEVSYPVRTAGWYVLPTAGLRYTQYALEDAAAGTDDAPSRLLPVLSIDGGMFFERSLRIRAAEYVHTLEPRVYYLLVPFEGQDDLPVFDTGRNTFSFAQLFRNDRFSGADRVGDAHRLTLALTSRLLDRGTGDELLRASIGQIRHFVDRKVTLPGETRETSEGSDIVAEVAARVARRWRALGGIQWDPDEKRTDRGTVSLRYQPDRRRVVNLAYRFVRDAVEQTDFSFAWPIRHNLRGVGRWSYAVADDRTLEAIAGLEYENCCWGLRTVVRRFLTNERGEYENGVFFQLELKGLAGVGEAGDLLERNIPGYRNEF